MSPGEACRPGKRKPQDLDLRAFPSRAQTRRRERRRRRIVLARRQTIAAVVIAGSIGMGSTAAFAYFTVPGHGTGTGTVIAPRVTMTAGATSGLYPGAERKLPVVIDNASSLPFAVTSVDGAAASPSSGCPASAIKVSLPSPAPTVAASSKATVDVLLTMSADAPDACQGSTPSLRLTVAGRFR